MAQYYDFAGQKIIIPGSYSKRLFPLDQGAGAATGVTVIMGEATKGGVPFDAFDNIEDCINIIEGQAQALNVFGGGDLYYGAEFYLTPSKDDRFNRPSQANCIVVNKMTQAETTLTASAVDIIDLAWNKWGTDGNMAAVKSSSGTNKGKLIEVTYKGDSVLDQDDVILDLMSIRYTGAGSAATMTINATTLTTTCTGASSDNLSITLANYTDMGSLINYINNQPNYTCLLTGKSDEKTNVFDAVTAQDIKTATYSCIGQVEAIIRILNSTDNITAVLHTGSPRTIPDNMSEFKYFTGGTVSAATTQNWTDALEKLETYTLNNIIVMSASETIHLLVQDHVSRMNDVKKKMYRQAGFGSGGSVITKSQRIAEMKALNSAYIEYCVSSFKRYDYVNGVADVEFAPYYLYPMISGLRYANNVGMDVVFKYLNVLSTPEILQQDQEDYAAAGGTVIQKTVNVNNINNFEIKINNTTYQGSQVTRTNPSVVYSINVLTKDFEEQVIEQIRGLDTVANSIIIAKIQSWITTFLFPKYRDDYKWITDGPDGQKAFDNVSFTQSGEQFVTTATLTMSVTPRFAFNFLTFIVPGQNI